MTDLAQSLIDALALGGLYALIAIGVTLIYTVMGMMKMASVNPQSPKSGSSRSVPLSIRDIRPSIPPT